MKITVFNHLHFLVGNCCRVAFAFAFAHVGTAILCQLMPILCIKIEIIEKIGIREDIDPWANIEVPMYLCCFIVIVAYYLP